MSDTLACYAEKIAWNYEKGMYILAFHMQLHQSNKKKPYSLHNYFFSRNSVSLRSALLIYKKERRKRSFWFQSINCSPGDPVYFF